MHLTGALLLGLLGFAAAVYLYGANLRGRWRLRHIPGPRPSWLFGNLLDVPSGQSHTFALTLPLKYGAVTKLFMGAYPFVILTDPELTKEVAVRQFAKFRNRVQPVATHASRQTTERRNADILWAKNKYWSGLRAACEPLFHSTSLNVYAPLIHNAIDGLLHNLEVSQRSNDPVQISREFGKLSLEAIGTAAFGVHFDSQQPNSPLAEAARWVMAPPPARSILLLLIIVVPELRRFWSTLMVMTSSRLQIHAEKLGFLTGASTTLLENSRREKAKAEAAAENGNCLSERTGGVTELDLQGSHRQSWEYGPPAMRKGGADGARRFAHMVPRLNSVFHKLLGAVNKETGQPLTDLQIASVGNIFILAGYDTTAIGLSWTLYELASRPALQAQIIAEVDAFGQQQPGRDDLAAFPFIEACFRESMRLHPPINPFILQVRQANQDVVLGGFKIPKGTVVVLNSLGQHMDPRHFPEPAVYRPERFLKGSPDGPETRHPYAELSFGAGPHKCIGYRFAMEEAVFALARLFQRYTFSLSAEHHKNPVITRANITLPPRDGIWVKVHPRTTAHG